MSNPIRRCRWILFTVLALTLVFSAYMSAAQAASMTVRGDASSDQPIVSDTLTVTLKISNAQNLFGVDVTLEWNPSVLKFVSASPMLGVESHSGGVLHESASYPIEVGDNSHTEASYHLLATSTGSDTSSFNGDGTIAVVTFKVVGAGSAGLDLYVELAQLGNTDVVVPQTSVSAVNVAIPEFPISALVVVLVVAATVSVVAATKLLKRKPLALQPATVHV